ncbi:amino acid adenylation domain-containing protein [Spirillospora sp. CA-255316]
MLVTTFEARAVERPGSIALTDDGREYTYAELDRWAGAVAALLAKAGAEPGSLVGVSMRRGAPVVAAILGVLKAGCGYVPLDPSYPAGRLEFMAGDSAISCVLGDDAAPGCLTSAFPFVEMIPPVAADAEPRRGVRAGPEAVAYVIYTSGSTGTPKGVPIRHASVLALFGGAGRFFDFGPADRWTFFHSYGFDFSVWELWGALLYGGRLVCVPDRCRIHPAAMADLLARERITVFNVVPSVFRNLVTSSARPGGQTGLRHIIFGGEALHPQSVTEWLAAGWQPSPPAFVNMYGITETTVHVTYREVGEADLRRGAPGTLIGRPLPHLGVEVLDEAQRPVGPGEQGEMYVSGAGLSPGYLNRADLDQERFPVLPGPGGRPTRYFRSGDLASWSAGEDSLVYHGRLDDQVKIRGFRVELGEIESALRVDPAVADAVVLMERTAEGAAFLAAYLAPRPDTAMDLPAVRRRLRERLPRHMIPERIRTVGMLPRTASGKVDRNALLGAVVA